MAGSTEPFTDGSIITAAGQNKAHARKYTLEGLNHIRQLIDRAGVYSAGNIGGWGEAYVDANGMNNSVDTGTDTTAVFDTNKYTYSEDLESRFESPVVIITATSLTTSDFSINDCTCLLFSSGNWILYSTVGTTEEKRAKIIKTLFYGTDGSDARSSTTYITGLTALQTSVTRDVGKQAYYYQIVGGDSTDIGDSGDEYYYSLVFNDTSSNTDCSSWSRCTATKIGFTSSGNYAAWELPTSTILNGTGGVGSSIVNDEMGTDLTADELDNPVNGRVMSDWDRSGNRFITTIKVLVLSTGTISETIGGRANTNQVASTIDFATDESVPVFTSIDLIITYGLITHTIPTGTFTSTISSAIGVPLIEDWETGADIQYKLTGSSGAEDTGWLDAMDSSPEVSSFTAFTAEPDTLIVKLIPKTTSPTAGYPSVRGFFINAWSD